MSPGKVRDVRQPDGGRTDQLSTARYISCTAWPTASQVLLVPVGPREPVRSAEAHQSGLRACAPTRLRVRIFQRRVTPESGNRPRWRADPSCAPTSPSVIVDPARRAVALGASRMFAGLDGFERDDCHGEGDAWRRPILRDSGRRVENERGVRGCSKAAISASGSNPVLVRRATGRRSSSSLRLSLMSRPRNSARRDDFIWSRPMPHRAFLQPAYRPWF
jgi:hypothetical protein